MRNIKCDIKKMVFIFLCGIVMVAVCGFLVFFDFRRYIDDSLFSNDIVYCILKVVMIFSFVFFGFSLLIMGNLMLFYRNKMIQFENNYMIDNSSYIRGGKIFYSDISAVYIKGAFLCIRLTDEKQFFEKQNCLKRLFMKANKKIGYEYITISDNFLSLDLFEIKKIIEGKMAK